MKLAPTLNRLVERLARVLLSKQLDDAYHRGWTAGRLGAVNADYSAAARDARGARQVIAILASRFGLKHEDGSRRLFITEAERTRVELEGCVMRTWEDLDKRTLVIAVYGVDGTPEGDAVPTVPIGRPQT